MFPQLGQDLTLTKWWSFLNDDPPDGFHGHRDEGDDGVGDGEVEHQVVHVRPAMQILPRVGVAWGL